MTETLFLTDWLSPRWREAIGPSVHPRVILTALPSPAESNISAPSSYCVDDLLDEKTRQQIDATVSAMVTAWQRGPVAEAATYRGFRLGDYVTDDLSQICIHGLRYFRALQQLRDTHAITQVVASDISNIDPRLLATICNLLHLDLRLLPSQGPGSGSALRGAVQLLKPLRWRAMAEARRWADRIGHRGRRASILWENYRLLSTSVPKALLDRGYEMVFPADSDMHLYGAVRLGLWGRVIKGNAKGARDALRSGPDYPSGSGADAADVGPLIQHIASDLASRYFAPWEALADALLDLRDIRCILLGGDHHLTSSLLGAYGAACHIPVVVLQHGFFGNTITGALPKYAHRMLVWGELARQWLEEQGVPPERLAVTGYPFERRAPAARAPGPPTLLLALTYTGFSSARSSHRQNLILLQSAFDALESLPDWQLVVRLHPSWRTAESVEYVECLVPERLASRVRIARGGPLNESIDRSTAVVVDTSSVGLEAMLRGKPVVVMDGWGMGQENAYVRWGATEVCTSGPDLADVLRGLCSEAKWKEHLDRQEAFVSRYIPYTGEEAARRIMAEMEKLIAAGVGRP